MQLYGTCDLFVRITPTGRAEKCGPAPAPGEEENEVKDYFKRYLHISTRKAEQALAYFQRPFHESYIFTYTAGVTLMCPWLQGADAFSVFARFLTEPLTPSVLSEQEPVQ